MKTRSASLWTLSLLAGAALAATAALAAGDEMGFMRVTPADIHWTSPNGPDGPQVAILAGDPSKPGLYVQRNRFPPGVFSLPHSHDQERHIVVIQGTWLAGTGPTFDPKLAVPLGPGSYMKHPAGGVHWDGAGSEEVIVQITGIGPVKTTPTDPKAAGYTRVTPPPATPPAR